MSSIAYNRDVQIAYRMAFNEKIDALKFHRKYEWLREFANESLFFDAIDNDLTMKAREFIKKIIKCSLQDIEKWLDNISEQSV